MACNAFDPNPFRKTICKTCLLDSDQHQASALLAPSQPEPEVAAAPKYVRKVQLPESTTASTSVPGAASDGPKTPCKGCGKEVKGFGSMCLECRKANSKSLPAIQKTSADPNTCRVCSKVVYPMEKTSVDGVAYHRSCFRCAKCNGQLSTSFSAYSGQYYCRGAGKCFEQLFRLSGRYDAIGSNNQALQQSAASSSATTEEPAKPAVETPVKSVQAAARAFVAATTPSPSPSPTAYTAASPADTTAATTPATTTPAVNKTPVVSQTSAVDPVVRSAPTPQPETPASEPKDVPKDTPTKTDDSLFSADDEDLWSPAGLATPTSVFSNPRASPRIRDNAIGARVSANLEEKFGGMLPSMVKESRDSLGTISSDTGRVNMRNVRVRTFLTDLGQNEDTSVPAAESPAPAVSESPAPASEPPASETTPNPFVEPSPAAPPPLAASPAPKASTPTPSAGTEESACCKSVSVQLKEAEKRVATLEDQNDDLSREVSELKGKLQRVEKGWREAEKKVGELTTEKDALTRKVTDLEYFVSQAKTAKTSIDAYAPPAETTQQPKPTSSPAAVAAPVTNESAAPEGSGAPKPAHQVDTQVLSLFSNDNQTPAKPASTAVPPKPTSTVDDLFA